MQRTFSLFENVIPRNIFNVLLFADERIWIEQLKAYYIYIAIPSLNSQKKFFPSAAVFHVWLRIEPVRTTTCFVVAVGHVERENKLASPDSRAVPSAFLQDPLKSLMPIMADVWNAQMAAAILLSSDRSIFGKYPPSSVQRCIAFSCVICIW